MNNKVTTKVIRKMIKILKSHKVKEPYLVKMKILKDENLPENLYVHPLLPKDIYILKKF